MAALLAADAMKPRGRLVVGLERVAEGERVQREGEGVDKPELSKQVAACCSAQLRKFSP